MPQEFGDLLGEEPLVRQTTQEGRTSDELLSLVTSDHQQLLESEPQLKVKKAETYSDPFMNQMDTTANDFSA